MNLFLRFAFIVLCQPTCLFGAKILGIVMMPSQSHYTLGHTLMEELADKGHEVTFISSTPQKTLSTNMRHIQVTDIRAGVNPATSNKFDEESSTYFQSILRIANLGLGFTEKTLKHENVQKLLNSNEKFDVVILEYFWNEALMGIASHFNCPIVMLSSMPASSWINHLLANPAPTSYIPNLLTDFTADMTFLQRVQNTIFTVFETVYRETSVLPKQRSLAKKYIPKVQNLDNIIYNTSIFLLNSHGSINNGIPHVPKMVEIGGYHIKPSKPLPKELQSFLDNATDGVILFSMGSNLKSANMSIEKKRAILSVFSKIKEKVLWKFETDLLDLPPNVKIQSWLPQQDVLAHKNVKAFITHGGLLSTTETIYHGKPIIGIPIFGDQKMNINTAINNGYALSVPYTELTEETLLKALNEILSNSRYSKEAQRRSKLMHDQPMKPIDTAIYWIEYAIRHNGAPHLQTAAIHLKWYQIHLLDVYGFIFLICLISLCIPVKLLCILCKRKETTKIKKN